jgi:hypothetical protein
VVAVAIKLQIWTSKAAVTQSEKRNPFLLIAYAIIGLCICYAPARAQGPLSESDLSLANTLLDREISPEEELHCKVTQGKPFLDFAFRFYSNYSIGFPVRLVRITPPQGMPMTLGEAFRVPSLPERLNPKDLEKLKSEVEVSGGFLAGEGTYSVEAMLVDRDSGHGCKKQWQAKVSRDRSQRDVPVVLRENAISALVPLTWKRKEELFNTGPRVTVLLDAAPIYPFASKLRAGDRAFLLSTLSTMLEQMKLDSVRVVAFNLDQEKEVFRDDDFDADGFTRLATSLRNLELGKVSLHSLEARPSELLTKIANSELTDPDDSDIVIFLGPQTHFFQKVPPTLLETQKIGTRQFFYVKYVPYWNMRGEFPDTVEYLTKSLNGTTFKIHSPADLEKAIQKISDRIGQPAAEQK